MRGCVPTCACHREANALQKKIKMRNKNYENFDCKVFALYIIIKPFTFRCIVYTSGFRPGKEFILCVK